MSGIRDAVDETIAALATERSDAALIAYTQALAEQIDERHRVARYAAAAIENFEASDWSDDVDFREALTALRAKLAERETLDRLGARLHAALAELGASPRARAKGEAPKPLKTGTTALSMLRGGGASA